jgi:hypothetical protein
LKSDHKFDVGGGGLSDAIREFGLRDCSTVQTEAAAKIAANLNSVDCYLQRAVLKPRVTWKP